MAQRNGLYALLAAGMLDLQPDAEHGQLYTIHGVFNNTLYVALLFAVTTEKHVKTYEVIFRQLIKELQRCAGQFTHSAGF
ncbi:unnamed protein product [Strongylus vulgaris]|uniref:Uncharacterized protein n=1 Tax=Strongylus vulgaris TaxID=40348 RepID=A0A3P7IYI6_STRVU|nr:unnamed protein product [Strongylus vulgaris]